MQTNNNELFCTWYLIITCNGSDR